MPAAKSARQCIINATSYGDAVGARCGRLLPCAIVFVAPYPSGRFVHTTDQADSKGCTSAGLLAGGNKHGHS